MISELPVPLNAGGKLSSYIDLLLATYPSAKGLFGPIQAERKLIKAEYTISELNTRYPSWIDVVRG
jgi:hypothetical protein